MSIKPPALKKGDTIGIISPASPLIEDGISFFEEGILKLKKHGYNILIGKYVYNKNGYLAGADKQRAYDLMNMFENKNVHAIICSRGGYGTERIIEYIDFKVIKQNPKIFIGYSNVTLLLNAFYQFSDLITFHGPMINDFGQKNIDYNLNNLLDIITYPKKMFNIYTPICSGYKSIVNGIAEGILVGGNLTTLISTLGTKYEINTDNKILFIEDIAECTYAIDRMLIMLRNSGKLTSCSGIIIGDFTECNDSYGKMVSDVIYDILIPLGKPIISKLKAGHDDYNLTLPIGAKIKIDSINNTITVCECVIS